MHKFLNAVAVAAILAAITTRAQSGKYLVVRLVKQVSMSVCSGGAVDPANCKATQRNYVVQIGSRSVQFVIRSEDADWAADPLQKAHKHPEFGARLDADETIAWVPYANSDGQVLEAKYSVQPYNPAPRKVYE